MRTTTLRTLLACAIVGMWHVGLAETSPREYTIEIAREPIGAALLDLYRQTGVNVSMFAKEAEQMSVEVGPLKGRYTIESALTDLLASGGLTFRRVGNNAVVITTAPAQSSRAIEAMGKGQRQPIRLAAGSAAERPVRGAVVNEPLRAKVEEEVIVTAQKRAERLIDVPQSVSVVSSDDLTRVDAVQFDDFANTVPGLTFMTEGSGFAKVTLRGVVGSAGGPTVGIYVDEVPYGSSTGFAFGNLLALDVGLFDLDRVEVLRGPQGTLYGASTMGGLVKYVTKRPEADEFGATVRTGISNTQEGGVNYNAAIALDTPLGDDKAGLRVSGFYSHDDGFIDNLALGQEDVNQADNFGGRVDLQFAPTEALSVRITGFAQDLERDGLGTADYTFAGNPRDGSLDQRRFVEEPFDSRFRLGSGVVTYDFGPASLISITSYQTARAAFDIDVPSLVPLCPLAGGPCAATSQDTIATTDKFTQEVRLSGNAGGALEWVFGGFYTDEKSQLDVVVTALDASAHPIPTLNLLTLHAPSRYEEYAAFGNVTWNITEAFDISGGVRFAHNKQEYEQRGTGVFGRTGPLNQASEDVATYLANARYHFSDQATGYVRFATGYRPGGPNFALNDPLTGLPLGGESFEADRLKSYELGFKSESAQRVFGFDLAGYYIDWDDMQITIRRGGLGAVGNAPGGAEVLGAELTLTARPTTLLTMTGAFAYQDAKMSEADANLGAAKGERLPEVPHFTAYVDLACDLPWWANAQPTVGATMTYIGDRTASFDRRVSPPQYAIPDYTSVDLRAGATLGSVVTQLYIRNAFDERGQVSARTFAGPQPAILQPRTFGISVTKSF